MSEISYKDVLKAIEVQRVILNHQLDCMIGAGSPCLIDEFKHCCINSVYALHEMCTYLLMFGEDEREED